MNRNSWKITAIILVAMLMVSGCTLSRNEANTQTPDQIATQNAFVFFSAQATATTMAMQAQIAELQTRVASAGVIAGNENVPTATAVEAAASATPQPDTATPLPPTATPTSTSTSTPVPPTVTPIVPTSTPTVTPIPCNLAKFVSDVSIPDGTVFSAGSAFRKTWRLKNAGSCTWTTTYDVIFASGDAMGGPAAVDMPGNVNPGQEIDISVDLTAPSSEGTYRGNWKLRDSAGKVFGLGPTSAAFYVDIKVSTPVSKYPLDFAAKMCSAEWTSGAGSLPCPGADNDSRGYVQRIDKPQLETGYIDDEPALLTVPQMISDGVIRGKYPSIRVESGHHFMSIIGCGYKATGCNVKFQLDYQIGNGSYQTLAVWGEAYDEKINPVDVDLSSLAGKDVKFILTILANGSSTNNRALWLAPRILKK